jgi:two-component system OmpR family sensor kinase
MHELKTPITKGRISAEMIENPKQKYRLISVFERLETIINEFASIERLTSGLGVANIATYRLVDIFDEAIDLSMVDRDSIDLDFKKDLNLNVDFRLFSLAIKNLIDNAIKYSPNKRVKVISDENNICFINAGDKLDKPLEHYLLPFTQGNKNAKGLGLGLYIVDSIAKSHKIDFTYRYENGQNVFTLENIKPLLERSVTPTEQIL